jgi:hypothetical protein
LHRVPLERELSDEANALMHEALTGLMASEEIEATVNERQLVPKSLLGPLSPKVRAILKETRERFRDGITAALPGGCRWAMSTRLTLWRVSTAVGRRADLP